MNSILDYVPQVDLPEGKSGDWEISRFTVSEEESKFDQMRGMFSGGRYTPAGVYTKLAKNGYTVMSDTRDERMDHWQAVDKARGDCLVGGLGLGMVVAAMLNKDEVSSVTVLENSPDVISLVAPTLKERYGDRINIIEADAMEWKPPRGTRYGVVWMDIWPDLCADNLPEMGTLNRRYARKADWKGCWGQETIKAHMARRGW